MNAFHCQHHFRITALILVCAQFSWAISSAAATASFAPEPESKAALDESVDIHPETRPDDPIAPGFLIQLSCAQDARLNGKFRVRRDGSLQLPYDATLSTEGLTLARLQEAIVTQYRPLFAQIPKINVTIQQKRYWIEVGGIVSRPGVYLIGEKSSLEEVISAAGGFTEDDIRGYARIDSGNGAIYWVDLDAYFKNGRTETPPWRGNEHVFFQVSPPDEASAQAGGLKSNKIRVMGEVKNPGEFPYRKSADAYYYLAATGGPITSSDLDHVGLIRTDQKTGARLISYQPIAQVPDIHESDMLIVPPVRTATSDRTLGTVTLIVSILSASVLSFVAIRGSR